MRRPLSKRLRESIAAATESRGLEIVERATDPGDGFVKYLFRSPDGALHEAVRIPLHKANTFSVCLSSQVGCAMACVFCATGKLGLTRNLETWEMVAALIAVRDEAPGRVTAADTANAHITRPRASQPVATSAARLAPSAVMARPVRLTRRSCTAPMARAATTSAKTA